MLKFKTTRKFRYSKITLCVASLVIIGVLSSFINTYSLGSSIESERKNSPSYELKTIVIDPGHGGEEPGTVGSFSKEKDVVLSLGLLLGKMIEEELPGVKVLYTRKTDVRVDLSKRAEFANQNKADLFISLHANATPIKTVRRKNSSGKMVNVRSQDKTVKGTETLVSGFNRLGESDAAVRENASILFEDNVEETYGDFNPNDPESYIIFSLMKNQFRDQSIRLATFVEEEYKKSGKKSRGVKEQSLMVLARTGMPAILTEIGFLSNPEEEKYMNSEKGQKELARELLNAIKAYKKSIEK